MDTVSLYFFTELARDPHITRTAERLFISQQTLSNHLARLERYYGTKLLVRGSEPALTPAGELVLEHARKVCEDDKDVLRMIAELKDGTRGAIRMGASAMRAATCLPYVICTFRERYPNVVINVVNATTPTLEAMLLEDQIDFAITVGEGVVDLKRQDLLRDLIYLCVRRCILEETLGARGAAVEEALAGRADLKLLEDIPICMMDNRVADYVRRAYQDAGAKPNTVISVSNFRIGLEMCLAGGPATFATTSSLIADIHDRPDDLLVLPMHLDGEQLALQLSLTSVPDRHQARFTRELMDLIGEHFKSIEQFA